MKQRIIALFIAFNTVFASLSAEVKIGNLFYELDASSRTAEVTWQTDNSYYDLTSVTIPSSVFYHGVEYSVTSIAESVFAYCNRLAHVDIPASVTTIGVRAFIGCRKIVSIDIPSSVTDIGEYAFLDIPNIAYEGAAAGAPWGARCLNGYVEGFLVYADDSRTNLLVCAPAATGEIVLPDGVDTIQAWAFYACSELTNVFVSNSVRNIGKGAFGECRRLASVTIDNSATAIGEEAFLFCTALTDVSLGGNITAIGKSAFGECTHLTSIVIPNSVTSLGEWALRDCSELRKVVLSNAIPAIEEYTFAECWKLESVVIPNSVTRIGERAFSNCESLTGVEFPGSLTTIGEYAFYNCSSLESVMIPHSVTTIEMDAFEECRAIKDLTLGRGLANIASSAFFSCSGLASVTNYAATPQTIHWSTFNGFDKASCVLYVPDTSVSLYKSAEYWNSFENILPIGAKDSAVLATAVTPAVTTAELTWQKVQNADSYEWLIIDAAGDSVFTLSFYADGVLKDISCKAPGYRMPAAKQETQTPGFAYTVGGLYSGVAYSYSLSAIDAYGDTLYTATGSFTTLAPQTIENPNADAIAVKRIVNGQLLIEKNGRTYTLQGAEIK